MNKVLIIAMACHQANKSFCEAHGDTSQKDWSEAEDWQRESAIKGVEFRIANPNAGHDTQHNSWMKEKVDAGWVYGIVKDADAKTHPCLVAFEELPKFQQDKDALFCGIVDSLKDQETEGLGFGAAVLAAENGKKVCRKGWNGKNMYAVIMPGYPDGVLVNEVTQKAHNLPQGAVLNYRPYWQLYTAQKDVAMWAPSGSDSLAHDWMILD